MSGEYVDHSGKDELLPGLEHPETVRYVSVPDGEYPEDVFNRVMAAWRPLIVKRGGASLANWRLKTPVGDMFVPVEFRIDLEDWSAQIELGAKALGLSSARIDGDVLLISDGSAVPITDCDVTAEVNLRPG